MTTADPLGRPFAEEAQSHRAPTPFKECRTDYRLLPWRSWVNRIPHDG
jgi:hypothetical protein